MVTSHTSHHQCAKRTQHLKSVINHKKDSAFFRNRLMKEVSVNNSKTNEIVLETVVLNKKNGRKKVS